MQYTKEVEEMVCVAKGPNHGPAPIPEEGKWIQAKEIKDISGLTHGIGWCAPQQGGCKLTLNVKGGVDRDKIAAGIKIIATNPRVEGIVINILGGFVRCDLIADGIIDAAAEVGMNIPLVVRFEGTNRDEAENVLKRAGLPLTLVRNMEDAADEILRLVREGE